MSAPRPSRIASVAALAGLAGCEGIFRNQSALDPAGPQAGRIYGLTLFMTVVGTAVWVLVVAFMLWAAWRARRRGVEEVGPEGERRMRRGVVAATGVTFLILVVFFLYTLWTGRELAAFADPGALYVRVTGHQWWWEVEYVDPAPSRHVTTANEIHVPVGRRIRIETSSADVIHSFWAPNLHGKLDMIPGYLGTTYFRADRPGVYRVQCAEFCGHQHAKMALLIVAEPADRFASWYAQQLQPAPPAGDSVQLKGQQVFLSHGCVLCHSVRGTPAGSHVGPDLTHLASRRTIGAGILPNNRGNLGGWVVDPQRIKPGVLMPPNALASDELQALLTYLQSLK